MDDRRFPLIMKTIAAITTTVFAVLTLLHFRSPHPVTLAAAITFGTTAYHFLMRLAVGYLIPKATGYNFDYRAAWFQPRRWETGLYRRLRVRCWKGKIPTYAPSQFSLANNTLHRIIQNTCGAEIIHEIIMVLSFLPLAMVPFFGTFPVFFLTSFFSALFDGIFVTAQRYNRPRLVRIYEKQEAKRP